MAFFSPSQAKARIEALLPRLVELRRLLHAEPELSDHEERTAARLAALLERHGVDELHRGLGGHGLAAVFAGVDSGPTVLFRADLDALPIPEALDLPYRSTRPGVAHKCGHDGHMASLAGLGLLLAERRPARGRAVLLFQPSEETGQGAGRVLADPRFAPLRPDCAFAYHNLPGVPLGRVVLRDGAFAAGSVGLVARLHGATAHAAHPEAARSPAMALARLVPGLSGLPAEGGLAGFGLVTIIHARLGEVAFGTTPGEAVLMATLRAFLQEDLEILKERAVARVRLVADEEQLGLELEWAEEFFATHNDPGCVRILADSCEQAGLAWQSLPEPFRWSEDFGLFTQRFPAALFGIGAGEQQPQLHHPTYDFPDDVMRTAIGGLAAVTHRVLG